MAINTTYDSYLERIHVCWVAAIVLAVSGFAGCKTNIEVLEPAHKYAVENQQNLSGNIHILLELYAHAVETHADYEEADSIILEAQVGTIKEQIAISTAYVVLIDALIAGQDIDLETFESIVEDLPEYADAGFELWNVLQQALKTKEAK